MFGKMSDREKRREVNQRGTNMPSHARLSARATATRRLALLTGRGPSRGTTTQNETKHLRDDKKAASKKKNIPRARLLVATGYKGT